MRLITVPGVFRPRSDSWMLAERLRHRVRPGASVLDPFTGSGVLAIAAALRGGRATAIDVSRRGVACASLNARLNRVTVRTLRGDMSAPVAGERFDLIVANPPYLPGDEDTEPRGAARAWEAGTDGRRLLDRLCRDAPARLRPGGELLVIQSSVCDSQATGAILADAGLVVDVLDRHRGPLGPLLAERAPMLAARGLIDGERMEEELSILRARLPR